MTEKYLVCPKCNKVVRVVEPSAEICYRANEILIKRCCSYAEALQRALDEVRDDEN